MTEPEEHHKRSILGRVRTNFLTGLAVIAPAVLTMWVVWTAVNWIDGWVIPFIPRAYRPETLLGWDIPGTGVVVFLIFAVAVGAFAKGLIGRSLIHWGERIVERMPVVRSIYNAVKQIAETVLARSQPTFDRACLVQYPRPGIWAVAFISARTRGEVSEKLDGHGEMISVFLPTTPNPTSGFLLFVPRADVQELDMSVEEAIKLVISAGLVYPDGKVARQLGQAANAHT
ncbi:DUF502 domain-containing protein [Rhodobacteraceae bacterium 2376]|uniref:DUF502 domain-containing protein n=1 Tax=Rhabdonatronobacter sediminivivens TaxID=2743469 RepID=A0A7Z0HVY2_9RHOB|nr:DUF502 domain-containing protein [Rhabdonatronobacter sediminivivens]NYS23388.1 DUF502 domain-containing protein [Rhabdonatronobacter sediminivivens]